ncbi:MAG TPA: bifunctional precorrin-2 dehydrogenase/sirohydrochlorin ferrochelatase [Candidatus Nitrosocosmicus sp.]|nr:bifunctional precorrin-2 dehydrogenase/sirohydrochlorin ferrochelatase [Candidatus Nitrosocosmicus sp.]
MIVDLNIENKNVLVIGAGIEGSKKIRLLGDHKCNITVISENIGPDVTEYKKKHGLKTITKKITDVDILNEFDDVFIIFAVTNDKHLNRKITTWARKRKILTYSVDDSQQSDFGFLSIIDIEESIQIAISTLGKSPVMAKIIRGKIEDAIKNIIVKSDIDNIKIQAFAREQAKKYIENPKERKDFLRSLINNPEIQGLINKNNIDKVKERIINTLDKLEDNNGR